MATKTLQVTLADIEGLPIGAGSEVTGEVWAEYSHELHTTDGKVIPRLRKVEVVPSSGVVEFEVIPNDDATIPTDLQGFAVTVGWELRYRAQGRSKVARNYGTSVLVVSADPDPVRFADKTPVQAVPPQFVDVTDLVDNVEAAEASAALSATAAQTAAADAAEAASLVDAPADTQMAAVLGNPASASSTALSSTYARTGAAVPKTRMTVKRMFNAMQAPTGFTKFAGGGTVTDDATDYVLGTGSLKIVTDGTTNTHIATRTGLGPYDFTGLIPVVWVKASEWESLTEFSVYLSSDNFTSYYTWKVDTTPAARQLLLDGEWMAVVLPFRSIGTTGTPNRAAINSVRVRVRSAGPVVSGWFGGLGGVAEQQKAVVSVTFDDGKNDQVSTALPIMSKYGIPATTYVICERIGDVANGFMTVDQLQMLDRVHGWEVAVHAGTDIGHTDDFPTMTEDGIAAEFAYARQWMIENGFPGGADHLAYPHGNFDDKTLRQARRFFASARTICEENHETYPPADPHRMRIFNLLNTRNAATVITEIDRAIANKTWLILVLHRIVAPGTDDIGTEFPTDDLDTVMAYLRSSGVDVRTVGDVIRNGI